MQQQPHQRLQSVLLVYKMSTHKCVKRQEKSHKPHAWRQLQILEHSNV